MTVLTARMPLHVVYAEAADLIDRNGWHVGDYCDYTDDDPARCPVCAAGAVILAAGGAAPDDRDDADAELCWFACYLTDHGHGDDPDEDFPVGVISVWNDSRRHAGEVTTTLRAAAAAAAREGVAR